MTKSDREPYIRRCMQAGMSREMAEDFAADASEVDIIHARLLAIASELLDRPGGRDEKSKGRPY